MPEPGMLPLEDVTVACSLEAAELASRVEEWGRMLSAVEAVTRPEPHMVVLRFGSAADAGALAALCADEVRCCPFFVFDLSVSASQLVLTVRVPVGAEPTLEALVSLVREGAAPRAG